MNNRSGDIDNDGLPINVADLVYFESNLSTISNNPNFQVQDLNRDNIVDASDVEYLANHILGITGYELPTSGLYFQNKDNGKIAIGYSNSITGTNSIIIGNNSSADYNDSIVIGANVVTTETNQIVIGDANKTSIFNGNVSIGTTTPTPGKKLHVIGDVRIEGSLTTNGETTIINTNVNNTERLTITNDGTGPAIIINQKGSQPIADFQDDGTSVFYIQDGGNVGIGTDSPDNKLTISGGAIQLSPFDGGTTNFAMYSYNDSFFINPRTSTGGFDNIIGLTMKSNGDVGIGTDQPSGNLHISSGTSGKCKLILESDTDNNEETDQGQIIFRQDGGLDLNAIFVSNTEDNAVANYLNIASSSATPAIVFRVDTGNDAINATERMRIDLNSISCVNEVTAPSFNATSDIRLKKDISNLSNVLDDVCKLQGIEFVRTNDKCEKKKVGFIAQDVEEIFPQLVQTDDSKEKYKSISYANTCALLVEAIKELREEVTELRKQVKNNL